MPLSFNELHLGCDPILTSLTQDYVIPDNKVGTFIAPLVSTKTRSGRIIRFGKEKFGTGDFRRSFGDKIKRIRSKWDSDAYSLDQISLGYEIPIEELEDLKSCGLAGQESMTGAEIDIRSRELDVIMSQIMNSHEVAVSEIVKDVTGYSTGLAFATATAAGFQPWNSVNATPIKDVHQAIRKTAPNLGGTRLNSMVLGARAYDELMTNPDIVARLFYNTTDSVNTTYLANWFGLSRGVKVAESVIIDPLTGLARTVFPDTCVLLFYNPLEYKQTMIPANSSYKGSLSSFWTYVLEGTPITTAERFKDSRKVVVADTTFEYSVQATVQGAGNKQEGAFYIENIFA